MNYKRGSCNGIRVISFDEQDKADLAKMEALVPKARVISDDLIEAGYERYDYHKGHRYTTDKDVAYRAFGHMSPLSVIESVYGEGAEEVIIEFLVAALLDSASADHWYTFEKDYE